MKPYIARTRKKPCPSDSTCTRSTAGTSGTSPVIIDSSTTCRWNTLLCFMWCSSTSGTPSGDDVMNTAVPSTRTGFFRSMSSSSIGSGRVRLLSSCDSS